MGVISFDFSSVYKDEYQKRLSGASLYKYLDEIEIDLNGFLKDVIVKENEFYFSCSSLTRDEIRGVNDDVYKNYFLRPKHNSLILNNNQSFLINGDFVFERITNSVYFKVKDIYVCEDTLIKKFEKKFNVKINFKQKDKKGGNDMIFVRNIISSTPLIFDNSSIDIINKWDEYLEFEKDFFFEKIDYFKTRNFAFLELKEIKRSMENVKKYQDNLYFDDGNNYLYLFKDGSTYEFDEDVLAIEFEVIVKKSSKKNMNLNFFVNQDIELASPKDALDKNDQLLTSNTDLDFTFKTRRLGQLLKPVQIVAQNDEEIIYRFSQFWVDDTNEYLFSLPRMNEYIINNFTQTPLLVNILSGEIALYKRGKQALKNIKEGNVKNPGIIGYLMNVEYASSDFDIIDKQDIKWSTPMLDEFQKESIYKALNANSIFLLQGPPGTGKTQTITEMVYQFNKMNKKVLLSSQTHIAIDNVLERLPEELNILPIRLINSQRKMKASKNFLPDKLVDNFYEKVIIKYLNLIDNFHLYTKEVKASEEKYKKIEDSVIKHIDVRQEIASLNEEINNKKSLINSEDNEINSLKQQVIDNVNNLKFLKEFKANNYLYKDYKTIVSTYLIKGLSTLINKYKVDTYYNLNYPTLNDYLKLFDIYFSENQEFNEDYRVLINKNLDQFQNIAKQYASDNILFENEIKTIQITRLQHLNKIIELNKKVELLIKPYNMEFKLIDDYFNDFFRLKLNDNKIPISDLDKLKLIKDYVDDQLLKFNKEEEKFHQYEDIINNSINYLKLMKDELLENDRIKYSRYLLNNNANVFGITCNANSYYLQERNQYLKTLGLGDINLKNIDFDVVIIDEVSKATLVELLIPIMYGKSIILVGDHRQLPPMFKYRENMFESLSEHKRPSKDKLNFYQNMVEESVFKNLFSVAKNNKYTLLKQYRSHEQIMQIVNLFYEEKLQMGYKNEQNEAKKHFLDVNSAVNGGNIFSPHIHTYWFNSHYNQDRSISYEKKLIKGSQVSTSFYNQEEIHLTKNILLSIDEGYYKLLKEDKIKTVPSIGVISLYADQVRELKKEISKVRFKAIDMSRSKISTVDEFQGKEEDIIIVNFVRNNKYKQAGDFVKKFERINVALSRARKMLVIVASKEFFTSLKVEMENIENNKIVEERYIYKEIYERVKGKIDAPNAYFEEDIK